MKRILCILCLVSGVAFGADTVAPATATFASLRGEPAITLNAGTVYTGTTLAFTNCTLYADTAGVATQGLSGVTVKLAVGTGTSTSTNTATVTSASNGQWACSITVSNVPTISLQVKITDSFGSSFIYPTKTINTTTPLFQ
jgi:hypothetical protein